MTDYAALTSRLVFDAFAKQLGGLTVQATFKILSEEGVYDAETDTTSHVYVDDGPHTSVAAKPTIEDMDALGIEASSTKLLVPGLKMIADPDVADHVEINGVRWEIVKTKGVPGKAVWIVFIRQT